MKNIKSQIRVLLIGFVLLAVTSSTFAQRWKLRRWEIGGGFGITQVFGDIGGTLEQDNWYGLKDIKFDETKMAFGMNIRYKLDNFSSIKTNLIVGFGGGTDEDSRNNRGREYKTTLIEFSGQYEYYFLSEDKRYKSHAIFNKRGMLNNYSTFGAYAFGGLGVTYANSTHTYPEERSVDKYKTGGNIAAVLPFGLGFKFIIDDRWLFNGELGYRVATSDFLDGYTQTEASKYPDVYYFLMLNVNYRLKTTRRGLPAIFDRSYKRTRGRRNVF